MLLLIDLFAQIQVGFKVACTAALFERSFSLSDHQCFILLSIVILFL